MHNRPAMMPADGPDYMARDIKLDQHPRIRCNTPDIACDCAPGTCNNAGLAMITCALCGSMSVAFICDRRGCPVNGGAAYA